MVIEIFHEITRQGRAAGEPQLFHCGTSLLSVAIDRRPGGVSCHFRYLYRHPSRGGGQGGSGGAEDRPQDRRQTASFTVNKKPSEFGYMINLSLMNSEKVSSWPTVRIS
jgi:hypothetical protein